MMLPDCERPCLVFELSSYMKVFADCSRQSNTRFENETLTEYICFEGERRASGSLDVHNFLHQARVLLHSRTLFSQAKMPCPSFLHIFSNNV